MAPARAPKVVKKIEKKKTGFREPGLLTEPRPSLGSRLGSDPRPDNHIQVEASQQYTRMRPCEQESEHLITDVISRTWRDSTAS